MNDPQWALGKLREYVEVCSTVASDADAYRGHRRGGLVSQGISYFGSMGSDLECLPKLPEATREPVHRLEPVIERIIGTVDESLLRQLGARDSYRERRDIAQRAIALIETHREVAEKLGPAAPQLGVAALHPVVGDVAATFWANEQYREAVNVAARAVNAHLQRALGRKDVSEAALIREAFSTKDPQAGQPRLRFPDTDQTADPKTWESRHGGARDFGAGLYAAVRNIEGHADPTTGDLEPDYALECLASLSLLTRWIDAAWRVTRDPDGAE